VPAAGGGRATFVALSYSIVAAAPLFLVSANAVRLQRDLGFGTARLGLAVSVCFGASAVAAAPMGRVVERMGGAAGLRASTALSIGAFAVAALASNWWYLAIGMAVCGTAHAIAQVSANVVLAGDVPERRQGLGFGVKQSAVPFASLAAGLAAPPLALLASWRLSFAAGAGVAAALLVSRWGLSQTGRAPGAASAAAGAVPASAPTDAVAAALPESPATGARGRQRPRRTVLWLTAATGLLAGAGGTALPAFAVDTAVARGIHENAAGFLLAAASLAAIAGRVGAGWIADRRRSRGFTELAVLVAGGAVALFLLAASGSSEVLLVVALLAAFATAWGWPGIIYYATVRGYPAAPGIATGIVLSVVYVGNVAGPTAIGLVAQHWSYSAAWAVGGAALALATVLALLARSVEERLAG
jgi:predicted MFS family arabinose efflux permease